MVNGSSIICSDKYTKLRLYNTDVIKQLSKLNDTTCDMKTHFQLTVSRKTETIKFHVVPNVKLVVEDMFNAEISVDILGSRNFLIIFMLVNARVMNVETGLESFSSLEAQNLSGGQG